MEAYRIEVIYTNRDRDATGAYVTTRHRVTVLATSGTEAELVGTQLVAATRYGGMPLRSQVLI